MSDVIRRAQAILVVDDDPQIRLLLRHYLEGAGFAVHDAASVAAAREVLADHTVQLVILDVFIPDQDGLELLRESHRGDRKFKILAMSGYAETFLRIAAQLGADGVIAKPFTRDQLLASVNRLLRDARK